MDKKIIAISVNEVEKHKFQQHRNPFGCLMLNHSPLSVCPSICPSLSFLKI